jgi:hypothetical protein
MLLLTLTVDVQRPKVFGNVLVIVWPKLANGTNPLGGSLVSDVLVSGIILGGS